MWGEGKPKCETKPQTAGTERNEWQDGAARCVSKEGKVSLQSQTVTRSHKERRR